MKFLEKSIAKILEKHPNLSDVVLVLPGKRPVVFIKEILKNHSYSGFLPEFFTIQDLVATLTPVQELKGVALWLFAYDVYRNVYPSETFSDFLKWFPTLLKDWDDILKFADNEEKVLDYMLAEERIKNWGEQLGDENSARRKNLDFWRKMNIFLPKLKSELKAKNLGTSGMISEFAKQNIQDFVQNTSKHFVFLGFNAFTPLEEKLVRSLLELDKADCYFQADTYYMDSEKQEAGKFLREHTTWKEFNKYRPFSWIENDFSQKKEIKVYEVSGNVSQTKILPDILSSFSDVSQTALVLLDENLLPATLDTLGSLGPLNITMGFPLKNLSFSNAVKQVFYLQKQLLKRKNYYYKDLMAVLEEMPKNEADAEMVYRFQNTLEEHNIVYVSLDFFNEHLSGLSFFDLLKKQNAKDLLNIWVDFCNELKFRELNDDVLYENISVFENNFKIIQNQIHPYGFEITIDTLEVLINQLINSETIDFQGEPLEGLQVMGLLETRLLNFKNVIMLSVNEGKLPLGNSQNTYLPFDVRQQFHLNTFIENDSIYAYHFYRFLQDAEHVHLVYNALTSGVNVGEKSRFITQIEMESSHDIKNIIIENPSEPTEVEAMHFEKNQEVMDQLKLWKQKVSVSSLHNYLYNPVDFYFNKVLKTKEVDEIEEELSDRNYGNLIHFALKNLYEKYINATLTETDLKKMISEKEWAIEEAIKELKHQPEFYQSGMNFIHKNIALKVVGDILNYDLNLVQAGNQLEIIDIERKFENIEFPLDDDGSSQVLLTGFIDRIDRLNGEIRIIDYKTSKAAELAVNIADDKREIYFLDKKRKYPMQLCIYEYVVRSMPEFEHQRIGTGIWSFAEVGKGVQPLTYKKGNLEDALCSVKNLILEILNPEKEFEESNNWNE